MAYAIQFKPAAQRQFEKLPREAQTRIASRIDGLRDEPFPPGYRKLHTEPTVWRLRVGDFRVIYQVQKSALLILVVSIGNRREVYR